MTTRKALIGRLLFTACGTLGRIVDNQCRDALNATELHHLIDEDGDGDWGTVWENLASLGDALRNAERMRDEWNALYKISE